MKIRKFKGKVVLAIVTGTWCPNCHDEAQYLVELYKKYHDQGLEIVALDFEEPDQQNTLKRVNAFIKQYKVPYTYLIAGAAGGDVGQGAAGGEPQHLARHAVHRPRWQGEGHARRFRRVRPAACTTRNSRRSSPPTSSGCSRRSRSSHRRP